ncbi:MAG: endolytic transglycosylase MltG [Turicibacter sp.]|nr:endolytic transglycosylase MltG [Turicibacter sp.]
MLNFLVNSLSWLLGICFSALIFMALAWLIYTYTLVGFEMGEEIAVYMTEERESYEIQFVLAEDTPMPEVAQLLEEKGVIANSLFFLFEMTLLGNTADYVAGDFLLNRNMSPSQINSTLRSRPTQFAEGVQVRIREGFTQRDIAEYLEFLGFFTADEFMEVANTVNFGFGFLEDIPDRPSRLEGYLFPDTYTFPANPTPEDVIVRMLARFNEVYSFEYRHRTAELGMTMDEIIIIASMIEREVRYPPERPMVAGVIYNRLAAGMQLQIDATVLYALGMHLERLFYADLEVDSPFNTYRVFGLPWGPISNPSAASIHAALFPANHNYLFYVLVNAETGEHLFNETYAAHLHARDNYMPRPGQN